MIKIKKFEKSDEIETARKICFKHYLYVPGWQFQLWLSGKYPNKIKIKQIFILYKDDFPIGCSIVLDEIFWSVNVGFFIKPLFRRNGFGKKLLKHVVKNNKNYSLQYDYGMKDSSHFFEKCTKKLDNITRAF